MNDEKVELNWDDEKKPGGVSDLIKKVVATGLSSPFLSEEQLKSYLSGLNLPKEVVLQVLKGAQKSKDDLVQRAGGEFSKLIQKIDIVKEFKKVLQDHKISIKADIEFLPKDEAKADSTVLEPKD